MEFRTRTESSPAQGIVRSTQGKQAKKINMNQKEGLGRESDILVKPDKIKDLNPLLLDSIRTDDSGLDMTSEIGIQTNNWSDEDKRSSSPLRQVSLDSQINSYVGLSRGKSPSKRTAQGHGSPRRSTDRSKSHEDHHETHSPRRYKVNGSKLLDTMDSGIGLGDSRMKSFDSSIGDGEGHHESHSSTQGHGSPRRSTDRSKSREDHHDSHSLTQGHGSPRRSTDRSKSSEDHHETHSPRRYKVNGSKLLDTMDSGISLGDSRMNSYESSIGDGLIESAYSPRRRSPDRMSRVDDSLKSSGHGLSNGSSNKYQTMIKEFENSTIEKQRKELQVLILELKERDRELNEMVASHQQQLIAWEQDRTKLMEVDEHAAKLEGAIQKKDEQVRSLMMTVRDLESEEKHKVTELENTKKYLTQISDQQDQDTERLIELEGKTKDLSTTVRELSSKLDKSEGRVHELEYVLKTKDKDFMEAKSLISELSARAKRLEKQVQEFKYTDTNVKKQLVEVTQKYNQLEKAKDRDNDELSRYKESNNNLQKEIETLKKQVTNFQEQIYVLNESEKRKDDLIFSQRSKQDRTDNEISSLRQLYDRQQKNMNSLEENLDKTKDMSATMTTPPALQDYENTRLNLSSSHTSQDIDGMVDIHLKVGPIPSSPARNQPNSLPTTPRGGSTAISLNATAPQSVGLRSFKYENINNSALGDINSDKSDLESEGQDDSDNDLDLNRDPANVTGLEDVSSTSSGTVVVMDDDVIALVDNVIDMACDVVAMETDPVAMTVDKLAYETMDMNLE